MKPFDLMAALIGAPVRLRNGKKAENLKRIDSATLEGEVHFLRSLDRIQWRIDGRYSNSSPSVWDIVGMWDEPEENKK